MRSPDGPATLGRDTARARLTSRRSFLKVAAATGAVATLYAAPRFSSFGPKPAYASITGVIPCLSFIDFDTIGGLGAGDKIGTNNSGLQPWSGFGVRVETLLRDQSAFHPFGAMIFKSSNPDGTAAWSGGDFDLRTPGAGAGNTVPRFNILMVSEDGDATDPDDDARGGVIVFQFDTPRILKSVDLIDIDDGNTVRTRIRAYSAVTDLTAPGFTFGEPAAGLLKSELVFDGGDNSWQHIAFARSDVRELRIRFKSSGAIGRIDFDCP
ncbi:MAG: twin-arginine translocation signal domain-containing protein [Chloroflexi bacterium]|nr:twin-arginine translocation signal domain-containing protein [Chloroflexota bacterium]